MKTLLMLGLLLVFSVLAWSTGDHGGAETDDVSSKNTTSDCFKFKFSQYENVFREAFEIMLGDDAAMYINCMAFDSESVLTRAVVSGRNETGTMMVYEFFCAADVFVTFPLDVNVFSNETNLACVECVTTGPSTCVSPCASQCERCYESATMCSRCVAAMRAEKGESSMECFESGICPTNEVPDPKNDNVCECEYPYVLDYSVGEVSADLDEMFTEEEFPEEEEIEGIIEDVASCERQCQDGFYTSSHGNGRICYACGIQFCIECHEAEEEGGHDECTQCLRNTLLFEEEECLAGIFAEIGEVAEEQEREVEAEEKENLQTRLDLAISLPIVCVAVVVFFIIMSFIAHKRYPHIGQQGEKRHRRKRDETVGQDLGLSQDNPVFRPQPTIRLR